VAAHVARAVGGRAASSSFISVRRGGVATPRYGIADFMYACICGALTGSASAASPSRTAVSSSRSASTCGSGGIASIP
jgi:hypothetical protein